MSIQKLDTSLAFCFYLRNENDFVQFKEFLEQGKQVFRENWLFSTFESKQALLDVADFDFWPK